MVACIIGTHTSGSTERSKDCKHIMCCINEWQEPTARIMGLQHCLVQALEQQGPLSVWCLVTLPCHCSGDLGDTEGDSCCLKEYHAQKCVGMLQLLTSCTCDTRMPGI